jgi:hypothetical protein
MPRKPWNDFVAAHPQSPAFAAAVSSSLPKGPHFDKKNKKLPTPYGLFQEWLGQTLAGDWSSQTMKGAFFVRVATKEDAELLLQKFPATGPAKKTAVAPKTFPISYSDSGYGPLAKELGYQLK